jgi:chromosome segregation ATPase
MRNVISTLGLISAVGLASACDTPEQQRAEIRKDMIEKTGEYQKSVADLERDMAKERADHAKEMAELNRQIFVLEADRELVQIDHHLTAMRDGVAKQTGVAKETIKAEIGALETRRESVKKDLDAAKNKLGLELDQARAQIETAIRDLNRSCSDLAERVGSG